MVNFTAIDAHAHCGIGDRFPPQSFEDYLTNVRGSGISGAVFFAPVAEIYDRWDYRFQDSPEWQDRRRAANDYLLTLNRLEFRVFPFFFIWNDFAVEGMARSFKGIKWHRHSDEPPYHYDDPRCGEALEEIRRRGLPVLIEEELHHTLRFIKELAQGITVIIPHLGFLNGGYELLHKHGIWEMENIFADTSLASPEEILDYIETYGHERLMFGSDFPFGHPPNELAKVLRLPVPEEIKRAVAGENVLRLLESGRERVTVKG